MNIPPMMTTERQKRVVIGILRIIGDGIFVCICKVYSDIAANFISHVFFYDSNFAGKYELILWCNH